MPFMWEVRPLARTEARSALQHALGELLDGLLEVPGAVAHPCQMSELAGEVTGSLMRWGVEVALG